MFRKIQWLEEPNARIKTLISTEIITVFANMSVDERNEYVCRSKKAMLCELLDKYPVDRIEFVKFEEQPISLEELEVKADTRLNKDGHYTLYGKHVTRDDVRQEIQNTHFVLQMTVRVLEEELISSRERTYEHNYDY
jgi:hypothetical protein